MAVIVFDLEGTLADSVPAVLHSLRATCRAEGLNPPSESEEIPSTESGIRDFFAERLGPAEAERLKVVLDRFTETFREEGPYLHRLQDGVPLLLGRLARQGHRLFLASEMPATFARRLLHHWDLHLCFEAVQADFPPAAPPATEGFLIGDRGTDMLMARSGGLMPLGALWGAGTREELLEAGATRLFEGIEALDAFLAARFQEPEAIPLTSRAE